jgi:hypothetical protein
MWFTSCKCYMWLSQIIKLLDIRFNNKKKRKKWKKKRKKKKPHSHTETLMMIALIPLERSWRDKSNDIKKGHQR